MKRLTALVLRLSFMSESRLSVTARYDRIKQICSFVVDAANVAGLDESSTFQCQIAVDESLHEYHRAWL